MSEQGGLPDLIAFCRVVDTGSVTMAARDLGETKGSVSRRIRRLEESLGTALFQRGGRGVRATEAALAYRKRVGEALDALTAASEELRTDHRAPTGVLRITAPPDLGAAVLAPRLGAFRARHPGITVEMLLTDRQLSLAEHEADVALRVSAGLPDSSLIAHRLLDVEIAFVAAPSYLARRGAPATIADLAAHDLLRLRFGGRTMGAEGAPSPVISASDGTFLRDAAIAGAGIAALPTIVVAAEVAAGRLVRVLPDYADAGRRSLYVVHVGAPAPAKIKAFVDFLREVIARSPQAQ